MSYARVGQLDDLQVLNMLDMYDRLGMTAAEIADKMGRSRNSIIGARHRVMVELAKSEEGSRVTKPENMDGAMPARWWAKARGMR